jgi:regulator of extracellular matrix RemA (YlzA/DUF370 family)
MKFSLRPTIIVFSALLPVFGAALPAPSGDAPKVITLRMIDGRNGKSIATSDFIVRINHETTPHNNWIEEREDGTARVTLPANAETISIHATYDRTTQTYINCDSSTAHSSSQQPPPLDHWYFVADILANGIVAPNACIGKKIPDKLQIVARPGEFIFFVRKLNAKEQFEQ